MLNRRNILLFCSSEIVVSFPSHWEETWPCTVNGTLDGFEGDLAEVHQSNGSDEQRKYAGSSTLGGRILSANYSDGENRSNGQNQILSSIFMSKKSRFTRLNRIRPFKIWSIVDMEAEYWQRLTMERKSLFSLIAWDFHPDEQQHSNWGNDSSL